jgi:NADH-quinone oxidoreductase subunit M
MPGIAVAMTVGGLASFGLPATSGFIAEFLCFYGMWLTYPVLALLSAVGIVLTAIYVLRVLQKIFLGPFREAAYHDLADARTSEWVAISGLAVLLIAIGCYPRPIVDLIATGLKTVPAVTQSTEQTAMR